MGKILLIQPAFSKDSSPSMPLGLIYIATLLKNNGHKVKILDRTVNNSDKYLEFLLKKNYDFVGIGTFTGPMLFDAIKISKMTKDFSSSIVVWGSFHPTIMPEQTLEQKYVDYIVRGEGEETFLQMVELYDKKKSFSKLNGVNLNPLAKPIDINSMPFPDYDLINVKDYDEFFILTSRGCPYRCNFCYNSYDKNCIKPFRNLEANKTIKLIETLTSKYNKKTFTIPDDNFPSDIKRLKNISNGIKKLGLSFYCLSRANYANLETLSYLKKAGAWNIGIGIESGSQKILNFLKKGTTVQMNSNAVKNMKKVGIASEGSFMIGLPTETLDDINQTWDFIKKNKLDNGGVKIYQPFPKTKLWDYCVEKNMIKDIPKTIEDWATRYVEGFDKVVINVSEVSNGILTNYHKQMNDLLKKGILVKKVFHYIKHNRIPPLNKIYSGIKNKLK